MKKLLLALTITTLIMTAKTAYSAEENKSEAKKSEETSKKEKKSSKSEAKGKKTDKTQKADKAAAPSDANARDVENTLIMELKDGKVIIQLRPDLALKHVTRIKELVREGFYDGIVFHRVIEGFMAQTGDPTGTGRGGSGKNLKAEFSTEKHIRGTLSMARANDPDSADSQFFIVFEEAPHLNGSYTVFGQVTEGMELVDKIKKGYGASGMVTDPDKIISLKVAADVEYSDLPESLKPSVAPKAVVDGAEAPKDPNVVGEKTETKTKEDGSIEVIKTTIKKEALPEAEKAAGTKELAPQKIDPNSDKPASLQKAQ